MRRAFRYQIALIALGLVALSLFALFLYRELFPEYRIYQNDYIHLEKFRSSYTHQPPPLFETGVKQIVMEREDRGPPAIDRCISCHVALQYTHFSPTQIARDRNGNIQKDSKGYPIIEPNPEYVWDKLDQKIAELRDDKILNQLKMEQEDSLISQRLKEAAQLEALKSAHVGEHVYDVTKVLRMHPLIGKETRPFEFHPVEEYGCFSCHNGNGRGLTTEKAHGPVFDGNYETEFMGPKPLFTESDPDNDPLFAREFNDKPGDALLFQTTPLFMGALIQAKCIQCHQSDSTALLGPVPSGEQVSKHSDIDTLTQNFQKGQELYISQGCYACHRIAGFARGGVGPELTKEGYHYPWFIKESLVWPQADLKTSTMPNYRMDHEELENLVTFLLAQTASSKIIGSEAHKTAIQSWEAGRRLPWEKPITPSQIYDLTYSKTVFATEGCAACHRLQGFESNVGYAVEKEESNFSKLYQASLWFKRLFPEEILGSQLVQTLETDQKEIDEKIVDGIRTESLLEQIEKDHPGLIESFYTPFKFASRAKNAHFQRLIALEKNPEAVAELKEELKKWKERVRKVLMLFVQEYGFGRLICPRPNWSGVYRSDEWLMEHFRNPSSHVPNSIMPVFPFDDTKFYALTYLLDRLGITNRDRLHRVWKHKGFDPELVFSLLCAQCHGETRNGNGPVAQWIYPLPKNLRNADFLRNLTKERAINSITHGVKGTPMPPWGEVPRDKSTDGIPILDDNEIKQLVDWLFSTLSGSHTFGEEQTVPKWKYQPEDFLKELQDEEKELKPLLEQKGNADLSSLNTKNDRSGFYVALSPQITVQEQPFKATDLFDVTPPPVPGVEDKAFYIKKKFYTEKNIEEGKFFFEINCAPCHGKEADGSGLRAAVMQDAKPRMLTNLDWIHTRDDLRLLRSIKYGVPGTSMTPWGDFTGALRRMQLVIFIRSLSENANKREKLLETLYQVFDQTKFLINRSQKDESLRLNRLQKEYEDTKSRRIEAYSAIERGDDHQENAKMLYEKEIELLAALNQEKEKSAQVKELQQLLDQEMHLYREIGFRLLVKDLDGSLFEKYIQLLSLNTLWSFENDALKLNVSRQNQEKQRILKEEINQALEAAINKNRERKQALESQPLSQEGEVILKTVSGEMASLKTVQEQFLSSMAEVQRIQEKEIALFEKEDKSE